MTTTAAALWTKDPTSGLYMAEAQACQGRWDAALACPADGSAIVFYGVEKKGTSLADPIVAWTGQCFQRGHVFRVFNR